jgi:hypothetical protein
MGVVDCALLHIGFGRRLETTNPARFQAMSLAKTDGNDSMRHL